MNLINLYQTQDGREQLSQLFTLAAQKHPLGLPAHFLEKDLWVVEVLRLLFEEQMLGEVTVAFKGGTALSKGWNAIHRFSEDIDLSIHWADLLLEEQDDKNTQSFSETEAWDKSTQSNSQIKKFRDAQSKRLEQWSADFLIRLNDKLTKYNINGLSAELEENTKGENIHIQFPRVTDGDGQYQLDYILLEFGARNRGRPTVKKQIQSYLAELQEFSDIELPECEVDILSPAYTLWEKLTALHQFSSQEKTPNFKRLARHWYDVGCLINDSDEIFQDSIYSYQAALDVVVMKKNRWAEKGVDYESALTGDLKLIPSSERLKEITKDHDEAVAGGMFYTAPSDFSEITTRLTELQGEINRYMTSYQYIIENYRIVSSGAWMQAVVEIDGKVFRSEFFIIEKVERAIENLNDIYTKFVNYQ